MVEGQDAAGHIEAVGEVLDLVEGAGLQQGGGLGLGKGRHPDQGGEEAKDKAHALKVGRTPSTLGREVHEGAEAVGVEYLVGHLQHVVSRHRLDGVERLLQRPDPVVHQDALAHG